MASQAELDQIAASADVVPPHILTPPFSAYAPGLTTSIWYAVNRALGMRFHVDVPTPVKQTVLDIGVSSGIVQSCIGKLDATGLTFARVANSGLIACPAASQQAVIPYTAIALLQPGEYIVTFWADNIVVTVDHILSTKLTATRLGLGDTGANAAGVQASDTWTYAGRGIALAVEGP